MTQTLNSGIWSWGERFRELTGYVPLPWQESLYEKLLAGEVPAKVDIPTGLGKTMVIVLWLLALAEQEKNGIADENRLPRRLCYVVNRRTIVDQSTSVVETMVAKIRQTQEEKLRDHPLWGLYEALRDMVPWEEGKPLAVSTLRGELADNREWYNDPRRPAIVIGTIDMIGSKLLFSGYGDSRYFRPLHPGMLGCDSLFVHDEAHLTPAFGKLLDQIHAFQNGIGDPLFASFPKMKFLELSATLRGGEKENTPPLGLSEKDFEHPLVVQRSGAIKKLYLHEIAKGGKVLQDEMVRRALAYQEEGQPPQRIILFAQKPGDAEKIAAGIEKGLGKDAQDRVALLTGQIRGYERDELLKTPAMRPFVEEKEPSESLPKAVYLVSTSAGEVGMDLHADHMICDLTTLDSMIQRLGRVNRFGKGEAQVDVLYEEKLAGKELPAPYDQAVQITLRVFQEAMDPQSGFMDASPNALRKLHHHAEAFSPEPETVELTDILVDFWSQTSLGDVPGRPEVAPWLHGVSEEELPETWLAWRKEASILLESDVVEDEDLTRWFRKHPLSTKETLQKPTYQLFRQLQKSDTEKGWIKELCEKNPKTSVILLSATNEAKKIKLEELPERNRRELDFATIVFPVELGRLNKAGVFDEKIATEAEDVAYKNEKKTFERVILERTGYRFTWRSLDEAENQGEGDWLSLSDATKQIKKDDQRVELKIMTQAAQEEQDDDEATQAWLLLLKNVTQEQDTRPSDVSPTVDGHNEDVADLAQSMAVSLGLPDAICEAIRLAGQYHDEGKRAEIWQKAVGYDPHEDGFQPKAKSASGGGNWKNLNRYRHDLGSLVHAEKIAEIANHPERDLILHLIATHHGWARPHFRSEAFGPGVDETEQARIHHEVMHRYAALQERFGHWRLAWLESLLRRADGIASSRYTNDTEEES